MKNVHKIYIAVFGVFLLIGIGIGIIVWIVTSDPKDKIVDEMTQKNQAKNESKDKNVDGMKQKNQAKNESKDKKERPKDKKGPEDDKTRLCADLPRNDIVEKLLNKRKSKDTPSDVTFELNWASNNWKYFAEEHYDWWMFPWKADPNVDSDVGKEWSILEDDVIDLLNTPGFFEKYVRGVEILIDAFVKSSKAINPVVKKNNSVHEARYMKIFCSLEYFERGANYIGDESKAAELNEIKEKLEETFGPVTFQYKHKRCDMHVWNV